MKYIILMYVVLTGCGRLSPEIKTKNKAEVSGGVEVHTVNEVILRIDVSGCSSLQGEAQGECINNTVKALGDLSALIKESMEKQ